MSIDDYRVKPRVINDDSSADEFKLKKFIIQKKPLEFNGPKKQNLEKK